MKMLKSALIISTTALGILMLTGCASTRISQPSAPIQARVVKNLTPDLTVEKKISGKAQYNVLFGIFNWGCKQIR